MKHKRNLSLLEARKIVGTYMGENSYASVAQRTDTTNEDNKYGTLVEILLQLEANDWPKFQEHMKKLHPAKFYQAPAQQQVGNWERSNVVVHTKTHIGSTTPTQTTLKSVKSPAKQLSHKSPIHPLKSIRDRLKNLSPIRHEQLKQKSLVSISQSCENTDEHQSEQGKTRKHIQNALKNKIAYENQIMQIFLN